MIKNKTIAMIGIGYVGLPTATMFASKNCQVIGYDVNPNTIEALNKGEITIEEPFLKELVKECVSKGTLKGSTTCPKDCDFYIIAVPTPINEDKTADMSYVKSATETILPNLKKGSTVILESTSPPRTTIDLIVPILEKSGFVIGEDIFVAHSPERILPGNVLEELRTNSRVVGGINEKSSDKVKELYETIVDAPIYITDATTAELCKVAENTFRDVNIAFANEMAKISEELKVNVFDVINLANNHPRVNILSPGPGVGGHCIALDPWFLVEKSQNAKLIKLARETNDSMPTFVFEKIKNILNGFNGQTISLLGVTYKPNIDDVRESPIMHLYNMLKKENITINICDPHALGKVENNLPIIQAVENSSLVIIGVNHDEFNDLNFKEIGNVMKNKNILDTRNSLDKEKVIQNDFNYYLLGEQK